MKLSQLSSKERKVIYECIKAVAEGPFFPDWEFQTLFGIERKELKSFVSSWPNIDDSDEAVILAINNSMANLVGYPHGKEREWRKYISVSPNEVSAILLEWKSKD
jgi:hypothetical protein